MDGAGGWCAGGASHPQNERLTIADLSAVFFGRVRYCCGTLDVRVWCHHRAPKTVEGRRELTLGRVVRAVCPWTCCSHCSLCMQSGAHVVPRSRCRAGRGSTTQVVGSWKTLLSDRTALAKNSLAGRPGSRRFTRVRCSKISRGIGAAD